MTEAFVVPGRLAGLRRQALVVGLVALAACVAGGVASPAQFFRSYLLGYLFWVGTAVGCLSLLLIHHLTGGMWGLAIRRLLEAGARTLVAAPVLFLPLVLGLEHVYTWSRPEVVAGDALLQKKQLYLNVPFFLARAAFYFAVWAGLSHFASRWSLELERGGDYLRLSRRLRSLSGGGLLLMGLTLTFASVDWGMSLDPHWFSTVYGILFMVGTALSALALTVVLLAWLGVERPLADVLSRDTVHDLGKLLLAFVMLWAYIALSQFLIVWSANLPEEIPWYLHRLHGGWQWLALGLVLFHFTLPFVLLLSRELKRDARALGALAAGLLVVRLADLFWLVGPDRGGHGAGVAFHWLDLAAPVGVGGVWLWLLGRELATRPLIPLGEPEVRERLAAGRVA